MSIAHSSVPQVMERTTSPMKITSSYSTPTAVDAVSRSPVIKVNQLSANVWMTQGILLRSLPPFAGRISTVARLGESGVTKKYVVQSSRSSRMAAVFRLASRDETEL